MSNSFVYKNTDEKKIEQFIDNSSMDVMHAICVINIDNFVAINEEIGFDEATILLDKISRRISRMFRGTDIVVRTSGDDFAVLINDPVNIMNVEKLCEKTLTNISSVKAKGLKITGSIGVALYPLHGDTYDELKTKALQSLARIKADGKNGYRIFDAGLTKSRFVDVPDCAFNKLTIATKAIDSSSWKKYFGDICFKIFKDDTNLYSSVNAIMEIFCLYYGFSRAFVITTSDLNDISVNKMHFCVPGYELIDSPAIDALKRDLVCRLRDEHGDFGLVDVDDSDEDPEVITYMQVVADSQLLFFSIYTQEQFIGSVVFENTDSDKLEIDDIDYLYKQIEEVYSYGVLMYQMKDGADLMSKIEILEAMDAYVYIIDKETYTIRFMNKKALHMAGTRALGRSCYEMIGNCDNICKDCPLQKMREDDPRANAKKQSFNFSARCWSANLYSWLSLKDNPKMVLLVSVDMDNFLDDIAED